MRSCSNKFAAHEGRVFAHHRSYVSATVNNCPASHKRSGAETSTNDESLSSARIGFQRPADSRVSIRLRRLVMDPWAVATRVVDHGGNEDEDNWRFRRPKAAQITHRHPGPR